MPSRIIASVTTGIICLTLAACGGSSTSPPEVSTPVAIATTHETPAQTAQKFSHEYDEEHKAEKSEASTFASKQKREEHEYAVEQARPHQEVETSAQKRSKAWETPEGIADRRSIESGLKAAGTLTPTEIHCTIGNIEDTYTIEETEAIGIGAIATGKASQITRIIEGCR